MASTLEDVCLPINLDAFVLNEAVCDQGLSRIAPITQPNYASLRLNNSEIQHDIQPQIDLHNSQPAIANPRISQTFSGPFQNLDPNNPSPDPTTLSGINRSRLGVYLHWTIPRAYRSGASKTTTNPNPTFPLVPNRWLVVRLLRDWTPKTASPDMAAAWIIESDKLRKIEELEDTLDIETDVTPFVAYSGDADSNSDILNNQAEKYIGFKVPLSSWSGETARKGDPDRVPLTVMNSSNPLFADYAIHNPNVFSTKDNLQYGVDEKKNPLYLDTALCDYVVIGWHSSMADDPLGVVANPDAPSILRSRLTSLFCAAPTNSDGLDDAHTKDMATVDGNNSGAATRLISHAARYCVKFDTAKPKTPADDYAANFTQDRDMEPVAVGTTPLDAVLAFFQAHQQDTSFEAGLFGDSTVVQTAQMLMQIQELLYASEDGYDARVKAADLIYAHNFSRTAGGFTWHYDQKKDPDGPPVAPSSAPDPVTKMSEVDYLHQLNECQQAWDAANRKLDLLRWALFSEFFKFVSDPTNDHGDRVEIFTSRIPKLRAEAVALQNQQINLQGTMDGITGGGDSSKAKLPVKKIGNNPFYSRADPTLCLAGIDAGWDPEFVSGNTPTRFVHQLSPAGSEDSGLVKNTLSLVQSKLPADLTSVVGRLLTESSGGFQTGLAQYGHKQWTGQPFCPQFVEWEGIYYHIDDSQWTVSLTNSALADSNHQWVTYVNPNQLSTLDASINPKNDTRHISGRMLVLPQPSFALDAVVGQVLGAALPGDLPSCLQTPDQQAEFRSAVKKLKFISGQLTGLSDALLTLAVGQHVKPNVRPQGVDPIPMKPAVDIGCRDLGMTNADFVLMGAETAKTPYGTLTDFTTLNPHPFKALQQGQFAITKLTIVDKFGQAISVPASQGRTPRVRNPNDAPIPEFIHPSLSEQLIPSLLDGALNTVYTTKETQDASTKSGYPMTPFVQLTPAINQDARINSEFLQQVINQDKSVAWKPCSDWENPIFGWIIVNYADSSLQFFTGDGIFYTALEYGGPTGILESNTFLPFEPPADAESLVSPQLDALIKEMTSGGDTGRNYFHALWDLIRRAIPSMPFPPSDYAQYANAIVGKPLALVNIGWSLELAQPALWPQHTLPSPGVVPDKAPIDPLRQAAADYLTRHPFHVKIGDAERPFDGVVAYWNATDDRPFDKMFTYFPDPDTKDDVRVDIRSSFPEAISPYFLDPHDYPTGSGFTEAGTAQMMVKTVLLDPYVPAHLYSGILPTNSLQLPAWTLQCAMKNMTAFFTLGPLLITKDVPKVYDAAHPLRPDTWLKTQENASTTTSAPLINLPLATGKGLWNWLQPYAVVPAPPAPPPGAGGGAGSSTSGSGGGAGGAANTTTTLPQTHYNSLEVGVEDGRMRRDPAPYTFVEGFLQLARPLVQIPVPPKAPSSSGGPAAAPS